MADSHQPSMTAQGLTPDPTELTDKLNKVSHQDFAPTAPSTPRESYQANVNDLAGQLTPTPDGTTTPLPKGWIWMPPRSRWRMFWSQEVAKHWVLKTQMMIMTIITGIVDVATYMKFKVFATKQTGNTLFLAIYAINPGKLGYRIELNVAVSIIVFIVGGVIFGQIGNKVRQCRRGWLCATTSLQFLLFAAATAVRAFAPKDDVGGPALAVIALLALASAGQITLAVGVGLAELNTTMITGSMIQLTGDCKILQKNNTSRNRRLIFIACYFIGTVIGSAAIKVEVWAALLIASCLKLGTCLSFLLNNGMVKVKTGGKAMDRPKEGKQDGTSTPVPQILSTYMFDSGVTSQIRIGLKEQLERSLRHTGLKALLGPRYMEGQVPRSAAEPKHISLPGDDARAMTTMCKILHGANPWALMLGLQPGFIHHVPEIAVVVDKRDVVAAVDSSMEEVMEPLCPPHRPTRSENDGACQLVCGDIPHGLPEVIQPVDPKLHPQPIQVPLRAEDIACH